MGDYSVDAINSTSILMNTEVIKNLGGWDNNIYTYLEDMKDNEEYPISKTQFYRFKKKETYENQIKVEDDHNFF